MGFSISTAFLLITLNAFTSTLGQEDYGNEGYLPSDGDMGDMDMVVPDDYPEEEDPLMGNGGDSYGQSEEEDPLMGNDGASYDQSEEEDHVMGNGDEAGMGSKKTKGGDKGYEQNEGQQTGDCDKPRKGVEKTGVKSKYFFAKEAQKTYDEIHAFCEKQGLQMAEVGSETDIHHLQKFAMSIDSGVHVYMLATKVKNGMFSNPSGSISFQRFDPGFKFMPDVPCVILWVDGMPRMGQAPCDASTDVLCQFKSNDPCLAKSAQEETKYLAELIPTVGGLEGSHFVIGSTQKTKQEADTFCKSEYASLLEIPSQKVNDYVWRIAREFTSSLKIDPKTSFWTAGSAGPNKGVVWNKGGGYSGTGYHRWGEGSLPGGGTSSSCVTMGAELPSQNNNMYVTTLRMQNCDIPHYFMCYYGALPNDDIPPSKDSNDTETVDANPTNTNAMTTPVPYQPPHLQGKGASGRSEVDASSKEEEKVEEVVEMKEEEAEEEEAKSCYNITSLPPFELNYDTQMEVDAILTLAKWTRDNHIEELTAADFPYKAESEWRKSLIVVLSDIFKNVCIAGRSLIPREFINTMTILISLYYNSLKPEYTQSKAKDKVWEELMIPLNLCVNSSTPLSLSGREMYVEEWRMRESGQSLPILIPEESVDLEFWKNPVIEVFWSMFSLSVGYCMPRAETPINWAAEYLDNFNIDYLEPVKDVWISKNTYDFGVIIGDFDLETLAYNIRACTVAAYMENGVADRQLIRPLKINKDHSVNSMNEKTGNAIINAI